MVSKKVLVITSICLMSLVGTMAVVGHASVNENTNIFTHVHATECDHHEGYHYLAKSPTMDDSGWVEFWACCKCGHQYIGVAPEGDWITNDSNNMSGSVTVGHVAYLPPLSKGGEEGDYWGKDLF